MPVLATWQWVLGAACAVFVGVAKSGVPGFGTFVIPLMVIAVGSARASAGWLLPMLCTADVVAIVYYRRHVEARRLFNLAPWVLVGMAAGTLALGWDEPILRRVVGAIVLSMIVAHLWRKWRGNPAVPTGWSHSARYGAVAGFATTVANAAGPVMNVYLLSKRLSKEEFVASGAWFFFLINLVKLPIYAFRGMITRSSLLFDACMIPAVLLGSFLGRQVVRKLPQRMFEVIVLGLAAVATSLLFLPR